jgi:DNA-binding CsgD family transcriptional regulator
LAPLTSLVGRDQERRRLRLLLSSIREGRSQTLVLRGPPGVGKTALIQDALSSAEGLRVVSVRSDVSDTHIPFSGLAHVLWPLSDCFDALDPPQRKALVAALAGGEHQTFDRFGLGMAVLDVVAAATRYSPLLLTLDDAHWLDRSSADVLAFTARRIGAEHAGVLVALRPEGSSPFESEDLHALELQGLSSDQGVELIGQRMDVRVARRVVAATAGNPLALLELARFLPEAQRFGRTELDDPIPSGPTLDDIYLERIAALSEQARAALVLASAGAGLERALLAEAAVSLAIPIDSLDEARRAGLLTADRESAVFAHPLVRSTVYRSATPHDRRRAHRAIAGVLRRDTDRSRRAWHLASASEGADEEVARELDEAGEDAAVRGAFAEAGAALRRAAEMSEEDQGKTPRFIRAGEMFHKSGDPYLACDAYDEAIALESDPAKRARIQVQRAIAVRPHALLRHYEELLEQAADAEAAAPDQAAMLLSVATLIALGAAEYSRSQVAATRAVQLAELHGGPATLLAPFVASAFDFEFGHDAEALAALRPFSEMLLASPTVESIPLAAYAGGGLTWLEEFSLAADLLDTVIGFARNAQLLAPLAIPLAERCDLNFRTGSWLSALADGLEGISLASDTAQVLDLGYALVFTAKVEAAMGREQDARRHLERALDVCDEYGQESLLLHILEGQGFVELSSGTATDALEPLRAAAETMARKGLRSHSREMLVPDLIEAAVRSDQPAIARAALDEHLVPSLAETRCWWLWAVTDRCRGMVCDDGEIDRWFSAALASHAHVPMPFERARTQLCYGERLRRAERPSDASRELTAAHEGFARLGAEPWMRRASSELAACGYESPELATSGLGSLTPQEFQVALAVAEGASDREAARALFLSPRTVESLLAKVYVKLGITSREELAARLFGAEGRGPDVED